MKSVPEAMITPVLCQAAVEQDEWALKYVPDELHTPEMYLLMVSNHGWSLGHVPEALRTHEVCLAAVQQDAMALEFIPASELQAFEVYIADNLERLVSQTSVEFMEDIASKLDPDNARERRMNPKPHE